MTTYYARAGGGNWSAASTWSLTSGGGATGSTPTAADDCKLDAASGAVTIDGTSGSPSLCRSLVCTGYTGTLTHAAAKHLTIGDGTTGNLTIVAGMTYSPSGTSFINFVSTTTGNQITFGGKQFGSLTFNGAGGEWLFQDTSSLQTSSTVTLTAGTLDFNNQTINWTGGNTFNASGTTTRALKLGSGTITLSQTATWNITDSTNLTLTPSTSTISFTGTTHTISFTGGGLTYYNLSCTSLTTGNLTIGGANTFNNLTLSCGANTTSQFIFSANQTITGTLTGNGNSVINRAYYRSSVKGTARTLTAATVTMTNIDLQDITGAGAGSWDLSAITGGSGDCGGNSSITFTTPANQYWVPTGGTSTGSEGDATRWANASGGTAGTGRSPLPQDTAYFDVNSIDAGSRTITQNKPRIGAHIWTGVTNTPTWTTSTAASVFGSITLVSGMTLTGSSQAYTYEGRGSSTITCGTKSWAKSWTVNCAAGTLTLGDAFLSTAGVIVSSGTFDTSTFNLAASSLSISGGTTTIGAGGFTLTVNGAFQVAASSCTCTVNGASSAITFTMSDAGNTTSTVLNVNADITCSGALLYATGSLNITDATITGTNAALSGAGVGGGGNSNLLAGKL